MSVTIIAEAGVNHNGSIDLARNLVLTAAELGADVVKFQTFKASQLVTSTAPKAQYQRQATCGNQSQFDMLRDLELTSAMHEELVQLCSQSAIEFLSTGFDIASLDYLASLELGRIKIPSGELTNLPYLRHAGSLGKSVILSTGMAKLGEIESALDVLEAAGTLRERVTVLHCNTEYPTPMPDVNLKAMESIHRAFGVSVGYSDHTHGIEVPIAAVALGAVMIEKHLTLDKNLPGPDHSSSLEPDQFAEMIRAIRNIELALGDGVKRPSRSEAQNTTIVRKSLVASEPIKAGQLLTPSNVTAKRPGLGISPMRWDEVIGKAAVRDFDTDELIEL